MGRGMLTLGKLLASVALALSLIAACKPSPPPESNPKDAPEVPRPQSDPGS